MPPFSAKNSEDAVSFQQAGNAILNKSRRPVNAGEQAIKMRCFAFTTSLRRLSLC